MNNKKQLLLKGTIIGSWINSISPVIAEIMSSAEFDFLVVDAEHSATDVSQAQSIFQAIKAGNPSCIPMVRLPGNTYSETKRYLDAGAMGVIAPLINTGREAAELVRAVKYPPLGERGVGFGRSHGYGFEFNEYMERANMDTFVCVQIEHIQAIKNLDAIFSIEGIDAAFIGPYDLSASMGISAQFNHPKYIEAYKRILEKCNEHKILPGIHVINPDYEAAKQKINEGFRMIAYSLDITILGTHCREALIKFKKDK